MDAAIAAVEKARREGLRVSANMYLYAASGTGLSSLIPTWAHSGGNPELFKRLADPATHARIAREMHAQGPLPVSCSRASARSR